MNAPAFPQFYGRLYAAALCLMPVIAMIAPRFTGLGPPLIAAASLAAYYYFHRRFPDFTKVAFLWALAFPALMAVSALWGIAPETSFMRAVKTLPIILSAPLLWDLSRALDEKSLALFRKFFPPAVIVSGLLLVLELYANAPLFRLTHFYSEEQFNFSQLNRSTVVFVLCAFIAFFFLKEKKLKVMLLAVLAAALCATSSLSAQLAFLLGAVFHLAFPYRKKWAWYALAGILAMLLFAAPWIAIFLYVNFADAIAAGGLLKSGYIPDRLEIWHFVSRRALDHPLIGHGAEATRMIRDFENIKYHPKSHVLHPHNFAIQLWIEFGALGAALAAAFFADLLRRMQKLSAGHMRVLLPLFVVSLSVAATGYGLWQSWWLGMFCLLFGYAAVILKDTSERP